MIRWAIFSFVKPVPSRWKESFRLHIPKAILNACQIVQDCALLGFANIINQESFYCFQRFAVFSGFPAYTFHSLWLNALSSIHLNAFNLSSQFFSLFLILLLLYQETKVSIWGFYSDAIVLCSIANSVCLKWTNVLTFLIFASCWTEVQLLIALGFKPLFNIESLKAGNT